MSFRELLRTYTAARSEIELGTKREIAGKTYRYVVINATSEACAANMVMLNTGDWSVSNNISAHNQNDVIAIGIGVIAKESFGWVQTFGEATVATNADDDISDGDGLIADSTADGTCDSVAAGTPSTYKQIGYATADDSNTNDTVAAFLTLE